MQHVAGGLVFIGGLVMGTGEISRISLGALIVGLILWSVPSRAQFPFETSMSTDSGILSTSTVLFGVGYWVESSATNNSHGLSFTQEELQSFQISDINALDRSAAPNWSPDAAHLSDLFMYSSMVAPLALTFSDVGSRQPLTLATMHAETLLLNGGVTYLLKNMFGRPRPLVYNRDPRILDSLRQSPTARRSFPSGHTSTSFASMVYLASVFSTLYPDSDARPYVWGGVIKEGGITPRIFWQGLCWVHLSGGWYLSCMKLMTRNSVREKPKPIP